MTPLEKAPAPMSDLEREILADGHCPDCNYRGFVLGPMALPSSHGVNLNIECGSTSCRSRFAAAFYWGEVVTAYRIEKGGAEGVVAWRSDPKRRRKPQ